MITWEWPQSVVKGNKQEQRGFDLLDGEGGSCIWQYQNGYRQQQKPPPQHKESPAFEENICFFKQGSGYNGANQH